MTTISTPSQQIISRPPRTLVAGAIASSEAQIVVDTESLSKHAFGLIIAAIAAGHVRIQINEIQYCLNYTCRVLK